MTYYKVLNEDGSACHGGTGKWHLPTDGVPGEWMPAITGELVPCDWGYHLCRDAQLLEWLGPAIFEAEYEGMVVDGGNKIVVRTARLLRRLNWDERIARLFACDCAEKVLPLFEQAHPDDDRPRKAIAVSRQYANGEATKEALAATRTAAWAAAWAAAWGAARAAAEAAAEAAARAAARAAAEDAARAVAGGVAGGVARAAARAAAEAAAEAVAGAAARAAAERDWQYARLCEYLAND